MSSLATGYSMYYNHIHNHYGAVFQNRYKSILVENDSYFLKLSQYIYLNPVRSKLVSDPINYPYSSLKEALGKEPLSLLDKDIFRLIGDTQDSQKDYEKFIYEGISQDMSEIENLFEKEEATFGSNRFNMISQKKYLRRQKTQQQK